MKYRKWFTIVPIVVVAALGLALASDMTPKATVGSLAPDFTLQDHNGETVHLRDFRGKFVVLEWFHPGCEAVERHYKAGTMSRLASEFASKDVAWLAIDSNAGVTRDELRRWQEKHKLSYPLLLDSTGDVGKRYGVRMMPHLFIINREGKIVYSGAIDDDRDGNKSTPKNYVAEALRVLTNKKSGRREYVSETEPYGCKVEYAT